MPIIFPCSQCQKSLQVVETLAGPVRCPFCSAVVPVPTPEAEHAEVAGHRSEPSTSGGFSTNRANYLPQWLLRSAEGHTYGPVSGRQICQWVSEGRVSSQCQLRHVDQLAWSAAVNRFPVLADTPPVASAKPVDPADLRVPHRGGLVLGLGIVGWVGLCPLFSVLAWTLAHRDLSEIRNGRMDPGGYGLTLAGLLLGMLHCMVSLVVVVVGFIYVLIDVTN